MTPFLFLFLDWSKKNFMKLYWPVVTLGSITVVQIYSRRPSGVAKELETESGRLQSSGSTFLTLQHCDTVALVVTHISKIILLLLHNFNFATVALLIWVFVFNFPESHVFQANLKFTMWPRMILNFGPSCLTCLVLG